MDKSGMKQLSCRDFGVDCDFVARGKTEEEVMRIGSEHGCKAHGKCEFTPEEKQRAKSLIRNV